MISPGRPCPAVVPVALALFTALQAPSVLALTCAPPSLLAPEPGATNVPTNARIWCGGYLDQAAGEPALKVHEGASIATKLHTLTTHSFKLVVLEPESDLLPETTYHVSGCLAHVPEGFTFVTGEGPLDDPPAVPEPTQTTLVAEEDSTWGDEFGVQFAGAGQPGELIVVDFNETAELDPQGPSGSVQQITLLGDSGGVYLGRGPCGGAWPGATFGAEGQVALGAFNLAGQFSGFSAPRAVQLPDGYTEPAEASMQPVGAEAPPAGSEPPSGHESGSGEQVLASSGPGGACQWSPSATAPFGWAWVGLVAGLVAYGARRVRCEPRSA